jgi:hypothetical protein
MADLEAWANEYKQVMRDLAEAPPLHGTPTSKQKQVQDKLAGRARELRALLGIPGPSEMPAERCCDLEMQPVNVPGFQAGLLCKSCGRLLLQSADPLEYITLNVELKKP